MSQTIEAPRVRLTYAFAKENGLVVLDAGELPARVGSRGAPDPLALLEVTPQINEGGTVTMDIRQEISSIARQIIESSTDLITNKREIKTSALVDDGDILVIGGLISQDDSIIEDKVPLLGDIPIAGNLFKSSSRSSDRRNLMVFLRPTIIRDRNDGLATTKKKFDYIRARELLTTGKKQSELERLIEQVTGPAEPAPSAEQ